MTPQELESELSHVDKECSSSKDKLHEAIYESGLIFMKISDWMEKTRQDFEAMLSTLQTVQQCHDSIITVATNSSTTT